MLTAASQSAVQIEGRALILEKQLLLTLPSGVVDVTAQFVSGSPDESTQTDMPAGTRAVVGYPSRALDFTVTDNDGLFDPNNTQSPLFGQEMHGIPVTYLEGLYPTGAGAPDLIVKFTGTTHSWKRSSAAKTVAFTCLDGRDRLRSNAVTPALVTGPTTNAAMTGEFVIDALLRAASSGTISSWPAPRPKCVLSVGLRASQWPEIGTPPSIFNSNYTFKPGVFGTAYSTNNTTTVYSIDLGLTNRMFYECWVQGVTSSGPTDNAVFLGAFGAAWFYYILVYPDRVELWWGADAVQTWSIAVGTGPHYLAMLADRSGTLTVYLDAASHTFTGATAAPTGRPTNIQFATNPSTTIEALQVTTETAPALNNGFVPTAVLDASLNVLEAMPAISGDPFQTIQQLCDAEQGVAGFDEAGVFRFKNRRTLRTSPSVRTVTAGNLLPVDPESDSSAKSTHVQVGYTPWTYGPRTTVFSATSVITAPPGKSTKVFDLPSPVTALDTDMSFLPDSGVLVGESYFRVSVNKAGTADTADFPTVTLTLLSATRLQATFINRSSGTYYFVSSADHSDFPAGTPVFQVGGIAVTQGTEVQVDQQWPPLNPDGTGGAVSNPAGDVILSITGNPWIQDEDSATSLAVDLLSQLHRAPILLQNVQIVPPDVRLQLGDRITLVDPVSGISEPVTIWGQSRELSGGDPLTYTHTIDARMVAGRFKGWILGVPGRSTLGVSTRV
jgi:hypothetical protein